MSEIVQVGDFASEVYRNLVHQERKTEAKIKDDQPAHPDVSCPVCGCKNLHAPKEYPIILELAEPRGEGKWVCRCGTEKFPKCGMEYKSRCEQAEFVWRKQYRWFCGTCNSLF